MQGGPVFDPGSEGWILRDIEVLRDIEGRFRWRCLDGWVQRDVWCAQEGIQGASRLDDDGGVWGDPAR